MKKINEKSAMLFCRANNNMGIAEQKAFLTDFCLENGYEIVSEFNSIGSWRTALADVYKECNERKGLINKVVFVSWDRLTRNVESSFACIKAFQELGIDLECVTGKHRIIRRKCLTSNAID